jgi:hypothetical protein
MHANVVEYMNIFKRVISIKTVISVLKIASHSHFLFMITDKTDEVSINLHVYSAVNI